MLVQQKPTTSTGQPRAGGSGGGGSTTGRGSSSGGSGTLLTRANQTSLSAKAWDTLLCAMEQLKKDKGSRDWDYFTDLHKKYAQHDDSDDHGNLPHLDGGHLTVHSPFYWLPWHRKFVLEFEKRLRAFEPSVTIPYWNWVASRDIPDELGKKVFGWMHVSRAVFHNGDKLPTASDYSKVTDASSYATFDTQLSNLHALVHGWVGGEMGNPNKSPNDPLFFLHHAFIDKTWRDWAAAHTTQSFPEEYLSFELPPWSTTVAEVLDIDDLRYRYA